MKMTEALRNKFFNRHITPYETGRKLDKTDIKILKILVNAQLDVSSIIYEMKDMPKMEKAQSLQQDMMLLLHTWKKAE